MMPREMPSAIEYMKGMATMATNAGTASVAVPQSICVTAPNIMKPTMTRAGAVANDGMARKIGERNSDSRKRMAVVMPVRPVRPP